MHLRAGESVGLLGGSFDPPHAGHVHITLEAMKRFGLDRVIWLFSPGNPLKPAAPATLERRMATARQLLQHPGVLLSDYESRKGTRYTARTLSAIRADYRGVRFVWLMGADNLHQLHKWENWRHIMTTVPIGVLARPGDRAARHASVAARVFRCARIPACASRTLPLRSAPAWCFLNIPMRSDSSSVLRANGHWPRHMRENTQAAGKHAVS